MALRIKFNLKEPQKEESLLMLLCRWNNQQVKLSTKQRVVVSTWDNKKQLCITSPEMFSPRVNRQSKKINVYLGQLSARLNQFYDENYSSSLSLNQAKSAIQKLIEEILVIDKEKEKRIKMTPIQFFEEYVEKKRIDPHTWNITNYQMTSLYSHLRSLIDSLRNGAIQ
jgi:hypothetical protein